MILLARYHYLELEVTHLYNTFIINLTKFFFNNVGSEIDNRTHRIVSSLIKVATIMLNILKVGINYKNWIIIVVREGQNRAFIYCYDIKFIKENRFEKYLKHWQFDYSILYWSMLVSGNDSKLEQRESFISKSDTLRCPIHSDYEVDSICFDKKCRLNGKQLLCGYCAHTQ